MNSPGFTFRSYLAQQRRITNIKDAHSWMRALQILNSAISIAPYQRKIEQAQQQLQQQESNDDKKGENTISNDRRRDKQRFKNLMGGNWRSEYEGSRAKPLIVFSGGMAAEVMNSILLSERIDKNNNNTNIESDSFSSEKKSNNDSDASSSMITNTSQVLDELTRDDEESLSTSHQQKQQQSSSSSTTKTKTSLTSIAKTNLNLTKLLRDASPEQHQLLINVANSCYSECEKALKFCLDNNIDSQQIDNISNKVLPEVLHFQHRCLFSSSKHWLDALKSLNEILSLSSSPPSSSAQKHQEKDENENDKEKELLLLLQKSQQKSLPVLISETFRGLVPRIGALEALKFVSTNNTTATKIPQPPEVLQPIANLLLSQLEQQHEAIDATNTSAVSAFSKKQENLKTFLDTVKYYDETTSSPPSCSLISCLLLRASFISLVLRCDVFSLFSSPSSSSGEEDSSSSSSSSTVLENKNSFINNLRPDSSFFQSEKARQLVADCLYLLFSFTSVDRGFLSEKLWEAEAKRLLLLNNDNTQQITTSLDVKQQVSVCANFVVGSRPNSRTLHLARKYFSCDIPVRVIVGSISIEEYLNLAPQKKKEEQEQEEEEQMKKFNITPEQRYVMLRNLSTQRLVDEGLISSAADVMRHIYAKYTFSQRLKQLMLSDLQAYLEGVQQRLVDVGIAKEMADSAAASRSKQNNNDSDNDTATTTETATAVDLDVGTLVFPITIEEAFNKIILSYKGKFLPKSRQQQQQKQYQHKQKNPAVWSFHLPALIPYLEKFASQNILWKEIFSLFRRSNYGHDSLLGKYITILRVRKELFQEDWKKRPQKTLAFIEFDVENFLKNELLPHLKLLPPLSLSSSSSSSSSTTTPTTSSDSLRIVYRDEDVAVIQKPATFSTIASVVATDFRCVTTHCFASKLWNTNEELVEKAVNFCSAVSSQKNKTHHSNILPIERCGVTSRLDKGTSGYVVYALSDAAMSKLRGGQKLISEVGVQWAKKLSEDVSGVVVESDKNVNYNDSKTTNAEDDDGSGKSVWETEGENFKAERENEQQQGEHHQHQHQQVSTTPLMSSRGGRLWKHYFALVIQTCELPTTHGVISTPVNGQHALTRFKILKKYSNGFALVRCSICTGRRHQIRLHLSSIGCPIVNDVNIAGPVAATNLFQGQQQQEKETTTAENNNTNKNNNNKEQQLALHLYESSFIRPSDGERVCVSMPLPKEFAKALQFLEEE